MRRRPPRATGKCPRRAAARHPARIRLRPERPVACNEHVGRWSEPREQTLDPRCKAPARSARADAVHAQRAARRLPWNLARRIGGTVTATSLPGSTSRIRVSEHCVEGCPRPGPTRRGSSRLSPTVRATFTVPAGPVAGLVTLVAVTLVALPVDQHGGPDTAPPETLGDPVPC